MNVVLAAVNAKYIHSNLAVHSLQAYAEKWIRGKSRSGTEQLKLEVAEFTINQQTDYILRELYERKPDLLAFSCYIWNFQMISELIVEIKKVLPGTAIWLGGPEVSYDASRQLEHFPQVSGIMSGEGEHTFARLISYYLETGPGQAEPWDVPGIVWRNEAGDIRIGPPQEVINMDEIPFPFQNDSELDLEAFRNRIIYYESSRGCPFSCSYCLSSMDKKLRFRSVDLVKQELQFFLDNRVLQVKFVDRTFNCRHDHAMEIWSYIKAHDNGITNFHFEIAADLLTEEELELLAEMRPGLVQLEIGVQSTNPDVVEEIDRTMDFGVLAGIVKRISVHNNIHQHLDLIAGLPGEDFESFQKSFNEVYALRPEQLQLGFLKVLKGSRMHYKAKDYGLIYRDQAPYEVLFTDWMSYAEILVLKHIEEMVEVYYNSRQFVHTMEFLVSLYETPFELFDTMRCYYEKHRLFDQKHSRMARYEILLDIIDENGTDQLELYKELLTYDLYLRENLKKRPAFQPADEQYRQEIRDFYHQEKGHPVHIEVFHYDVAGDGHSGEFPMAFYYEERDPLSHEAKTVPVRIEKGVGVRDGNS